MNHISIVEEQRDKERKGMMKKGTSLSLSESSPRQFWGHSSGRKYLQTARSHIPVSSFLHFLCKTKCSGSTVSPGMYETCSCQPKYTGGQLEALAIEMLMQLSQQDGLPFRYEGFCTVQTIERKT
jgi:hypothetical protein